MSRPYTLREREWLDALNAAMALTQEAEEMGKPFPDEYAHHQALDTWGGVTANLMALCNEIWEKAHREEENTKFCPGCGVLVGEWHYPACTKNDALLQGKRFSGNWQADRERERP